MEKFFEKFDAFVIAHPIVSVIGVAAIISSIGLLFNFAASLPFAAALWVAFAVGYRVVSKK